MRVVAGSGLCRRWLEVGWILADLDTSMILIWTDIRAANGFHKHGEDPSGLKAPCLGVYLA